MKCEECGVKRKNDESVMEIECGYYRELFDIEILEVVCNYCELAHTMET